MTVPSPKILELVKTTWPIAQAVQSILIRNDTLLNVTCAGCVVPYLSLEADALMYVTDGEVHTFVWSAEATRKEREKLLAAASLLLDGAE